MPEQGKISELNTILLRNAVFYARNLLLQVQSCEGDEFIKKNFYQPTFKFSERILSFVLLYSRLNLPIDFSSKGKGYSPLRSTMGSFGSA